MATIPLPAASAPDPAPLLLRYRRALDAVDELPSVYLVRRRAGRLNWLGRSMRTKLLLRFFVRWHVTARVAELRRASLAQAAVDRTEPSYAEVATQLEEFEKSLPVVRLRRALLTSLVSVFVVAFLLARAAPNWDPTLSFLFKDDGGSAPVGMRDASEPLEKMTAALLTLKPTSFGDAMRAVACKKGTGNSSEACSAQRALVSSVTSVIVLCLAVWIVTLLPLTSFRLKRMLFNLDADDGVRELLRSQSAWTHFHSAEGIYVLEAEFFRRLGRQRPRETPLDLACQACLMVLPVYAATLTAIFAVYGVRWDIRNGRYPGDATALAVIALLSVVFAAFACARLATLRWAHRRRTAGVCSQHGDRAHPQATLRRRFIAHFTDSCPFVVLGALLVLRMPLFSTSEIGGLLAVFVLAPLALALIQGAVVARTGRTIGKAFWRLDVVRSDGSPASRGRVLVREVLFKGVVCGLPLLLLAVLLRHLPFSAQIWWLAAPAWAVYLTAYGCATWNMRRSPLHDLVLDTAVVDGRR